MTDFGDYCCGIDRHIHELLEDSEEQKKSNEIRNVGYQPPQFYHVVHINEAEKLTESGSSFIAYSIVFGDYEVKRRYSEFESLRTCLCRLYPTFIVPPIPEKHSIAQYAVLQKRAKEDQYIIERRKRMLEHFINHLVEHPILSSEHIFHRFLENGVSWTEVLHSPIITNLPKSPLHSSPSRAPGSSINDGTNIQLPKIAATNSFAGDVPIPSTLSPIKNVEPRWMDCELFTNKYANQFTGLVEKSENKIYRKLGELSADYAELGATLNGFSLLEQEQEELAAAIEKAGQAVDSSYIEINQLLTQMEAEVSEPIHEYSQYASAIKQVLKFRLLKNLQAENVQEALIRQRVKLENLLQADDEAKRLAQALESSGHSATNNVGGSAQGVSTQHASADSHDAGDAAEEAGAAHDVDESEAQVAHGFVAPHRASTDASSINAAAGGGIAGRSRGASISSTYSGGYQHTEFTPTLSPRGIPEDAEIDGTAAFSGGVRQRSGTATSGGSTGTRNRRRSNGWPSSNGPSSLAALNGDLDEDKNKDILDDVDDPLAQFQQEESVLWGDGTRSTLPQFHAHSRSSSSQKQQQQNADDADGHSGDAVSHAHMARSEFIGSRRSPRTREQSLPRNARDLQQKQAQHAASGAPGLHGGQGFTGNMAASTPALKTVRKDTPSLGAFPEAQRQQHHRAVSQSSTIATSSSSNNNNNNNNSNNNGSTSSLGARLLRSPKVLGDGIMSKLTYALNGMMDVDPEQMRRNQIGRASDKISMLEEQLEMLSNDLVLVNTSTQDNLDRFQKQKVREMKGILIAFAKMHLEWAEKNLEIWKEAKEAVDEV